MAKKEISLLVDQSFDFTLTGRVVGWLTTIGRFIVIFTELVVIGAFISRFWLDRKNSDLSADLRQKRAILESASEFENDFRAVQDQLSKGVVLAAQSGDLAFPLTTVAQKIPDDIVVDDYKFNVSSDRQTVSLSILVYSESSLAQFINNIVNDPSIESVRVGMIKREKLSSGTNITLQVNFKTE
jgi:hypothetical protein